jgi:hypothetical protein
MSTKVKEAELVPVNGSQALERAQPSMAEVLMRAVEQGASIETLERIAKMVEEAQARKAKAEFFEALARFQSLVPEIPKSKKGYGYYYAPLSAIDKAIKEPAEQCGLSKRWVQVETEDTVTVSCVITHIGGHSETSSIGPIGWDLLERTERMNGLQHRAAAISYLQRYTLIAALGLATADDDLDGGISPEEARRARPVNRPVNQPKETPSARKAKAVEEENRVQITPVVDGEDGISKAQGDGLVKAMKASGLSGKHFTARFPAMSRLGELRAQDMPIVLRWINDPEKN